MLDTFREEYNGTIKPLIEGIVGDGQTLFRQEIALMKSEVRRELVRARSKAISVSIGIGCALISVTLFAVMFVRLLEWLAPALPIWACYAIVASLYCVAGASLCSRDRSAPPRKPGTLLESTPVELV